ncbi:MAG: hypothetical protein IJL89_04080 [Firmicutes bacterium]|nr:hypothetical protein [Bacillota bacterium]
MVQHTVTHINLCPIFSVLSMILIVTCIAIASNNDRSYSDIKTLYNRKEIENLYEELSDSEIVIITCHTNRDAVYYINKNNVITLYGLPNDIDPFNTKAFKKYNVYKCDIQNITKFKYNIFAKEVKYYCNGKAVIDDIRWKNMDYESSYLYIFFKNKRYILEIDEKSKFFTLFTEFAELEGAFIAIQ